MALSKQVHLYSLDTSCFYTEEELFIHKKLLKLYLFRARIKAKYSKHKINDRIYKKYLAKCNAFIKYYKGKMYEEFETTRQKGIVRELRKETLMPKNIVSVFDSFLTRTLGLEIGSLTMDLIIVNVFFFQVAEDLIKHGFVFEGEKYVLYTASAGQIRTKKFVMIKQSVLDKYKDTLTCGLSVEQINAKGGVNVNKFLAYYALTNSATDVWTEFDITKSIVVEDFETNVRDLVDFMNDADYTIERREMDVPIPHMDGCGIMLDGLTTMVRMPWVKGLMVKFDFRRFILEQRDIMGDDRIGVVQDIYGQEVDVIAEDIKYIFTKSQFKMWKYYDSWQQYQENFIKYGCTAGKCNEEFEKIPNATINYQMLQSLSDMSEEEMTRLAKRSIKDITKIGKDYRTTMRLLGVTEYNQNKTYMQEALEICPELMRDKYNKEILKSVKKCLTKEAKGGKLSIFGKYTFLSPDLYAFCEWLFLKIPVPDGLLGKGEVSCNLYADGIDLDCLRSPHLYREHAVRKNVVNEDISKWFDTKCIYTSTKDTISKILQFD